MSHALDTQCREVFVRAVCAKGRATSEQVHTIVPPPGVQDVLGCRVVGLQHRSRLRDNTVRISGEYEIQVWVAFNDESELIRQRVEFRQDVHVVDVGEGCMDDQPEVLVDITDGPDVAECAVNKAGHIDVVVTMSINVDVVGETRLFVQTCQPSVRIASGRRVADEEWDWTDDHPRGI